MTDTDISMLQPGIVEGALVRQTWGERRLMLVLRIEGTEAVCLGRGRSELSYPLDALKLAYLPPSASDQDDGNPMLALLSLRC